MATKARVKFNAKSWGDAVMKKIAEEQTRLLVAYAEEEIKKIGNDISVYQSKNNLDRTGNLLDSLCCGVCYNGRIVSRGKYRKVNASTDSNLHEYSNPKGRSVNGKFESSQFLATYKPTVTKGWEVFFAVVAPYWGYWEKGFSAPRGIPHQWQVMTNHFDIVKSELSPSKVEFSIYTPD